MQYAFLIYRDEAAYDAERGNAAAMQQLGAKHMAFSREMGDARIAGAGLKGVAVATTVRTALDGRQTVHDGPFADTKEQLGGFYVIDAPDTSECGAGGSCDTCRPPSDQGSDEPPSS
jgi:hypothetical protein